ncbi:MAG: hypothetical protein JWM10_5051, partial [Myxococcaceae bacterium]|nr:hypothetical protein [Myxococcaceae bacterium]
GPPPPGTSHGSRRGAAGTATRPAVAGRSVRGAGPESRGAQWAHSAATDNAIHGATDGRLRRWAAPGRSAGRVRAALTRAAPELPRAARAGRAGDERCRTRPAWSRIGCQRSSRETTIPGRSSATTTASRKAAPSTAAPTRSAPGRPRAEDPAEGAAHRVVGAHWYPSGSVCGRSTGRRIPRIRDQPGAAGRADEVRDFEAAVHWRCVARARRPERLRAGR